MDDNRPAAVANPLVIDTTGNGRAVHGFLYGLRQPAIVLPIRLRYYGDEAAALARLDRELREIFPDAGPPQFPDAGAERLTSRLLFWTDEMQRRAGLGVFETGKTLPVGEEGQNRFRILAPVMPHTQASVAQAMQWLLRFFNYAWAGRPMARLHDGLPGIGRILEQAAPGTTNTVPFLQAAYGLDIPISRIAGGAYQFGHGARSRWMDSSFTDRASQVSAALARNKRLTALVLARAGLPVPVHLLVGDRAQAVIAAGKLGYPVVVKPADKDAGVGVAAGLPDESAVRKAFDRARRISSQILVERHVQGRDYRLTVLDGELIWAVERIPGGVTGDGERTVRELNERLNADPRRGKAAHFPLRPLAMDDEANELLSRQSLSLEDVPESGRFVRLRGTANVANGGVPVAVTDRAHPDNRRLAERAAKVLRLDLAGIDLLIPDIARSWRETGGVICEVNAQPNIGRTTAAHLYQPILRRLIGGDGRVPITVILGGGASSAAVADGIEGFYRNRGLCVGRFEHARVTVAGERMVEKLGSVFAAGEMLIADTRVGAVVFCIDDVDVLRLGLPFDAFDTLVVAADDSRMGKSPATVEAVVEALRPACRGEVLVGDDWRRMCDGGCGE